MKCGRVSYREAFRLCHPSHQEQRVPAHGQQRGGVNVRGSVARCGEHVGVMWMRRSPFELRPNWRQNTGDKYTLSSVGICVGERVTGLFGHSVARSLAFGHIHAPLRGNLEVVFVRVSLIVFVSFSGGFWGGSTTSFARSPVWHT